MTKVSRKSRQLNKKQTNVSRSICNNTIDYINLLTTQSTIKTNKNNKYNFTSFDKYKKYIKIISSTFINSQNTLLTDIFNIKNTTLFTLSYNEEVLQNSSTHTIPKFIDLIRYLMNINTFITKFTLDEQKILKDNLSIKKTNHECYMFFDKSQIGSKIMSIFNDYNISNMLSNDSVFTKQFPSLEFHNLLFNSFTSYKILEDLELNIKRLIKYSIEWKGKIYNNIVYLFIYDSNYTDAKINEIGTEIIKRILFFNDFLNSKSYPDKFIIFLTDNKKEIDKELVEEAHFKTSHVNTAVTNSKDIIIYREQELFKSIFHELIHFHNLDFRHVSRNILNKIINYLITSHNINSNNEYILYECSAEVLANILNNIYYSRSINEFNTNLQNEIIFSTLQICKILHICKYKRWSDFSLHNSNNTSGSVSNTLSSHTIKKTKQFKQDSCVFSYYILKLYLLLNLDSYFKTILDSKMKFIQTKESFNKLIEIFDSSRNNIVLENIINSILKGLNKQTLYEKLSIKKTKLLTLKHKKNKIDKTLRMTCLESNIFLNNAI